MAKPPQASPPPAAHRPSTPAPSPASPSPQPGIAPGSVAAKIHAHAEDAAAQPQPVDIKREANARKNAAIAARLDAHRKGEVESAEVATESEAPKAKPATTAAARDTSVKAPTADNAKAQGDSPGEASPSDSKTESGETAEQTAAREKRYDVKSIRDWARKNPEEAAEVAKQVFHVDGNLSAEWIRVQNKHRKRQTALDEREKQLTEQAAKQESDSKDTIDTLTPIANLFEAVNPDRGQEGGKFDPKKIDFDAADQAWQDLTGVPIDEYMRHRARKGVAINPEMRALKLENERLKKAAEKASPEEATGDKAEAKPNGKAKDAAPELVGNKWESDIPEEHGLRQFAGWQKDLTKAMAPYHDADLDEYSKDPEEIADKLLLRKVKEFEVEEAEPEVKPKPKPPVARAPVVTKPKAPAADDIIPADAYSYRKPAAKPEAENEPAVPKDFTARKRMALDRHNKRMRGELTADD